MVKKLGEFANKIPYKNWVFPFFAVNLLLIILVLVFRSQLPPVVPLFYGQPSGAEQLANRHFLALPPTIAMFVCIINTVVNYYIKDEFIKKIFLGGMIVATLFSLITIVKIFFLVGNI